MSAGESGIGEAAWKGFEKQLRAFVRRRVEPQSVDDLVAATLLRLVQNSDALAATDNPSAFVHRVCSNAVTDHYRRKAVEKHALSERDMELRNMIDRGEISDPDEAKHELSQCMRPFIEQLPSPYRDALILTELGQLKQKHAAERLGLSVSGLKSRVQRGRAMLKQSLLRCCFIEQDPKGNVIDYERRSTGCRRAC